MSLFNIAELRSITSEALQSKIRTLLPSQQGFGADLQSTNVIVPVVDLTAAAEGSGVDITLQQALAFQSVTAFDIANATQTIIDNTGFHRVFGSANASVSSGAGLHGRFNLATSLASKIIYEISYPAGLTDQPLQSNFDFIVFIAAGERLEVETNNAYVTFAGCTRQIADINGNLVNPGGFNPQ